MNKNIIQNHYERIIKLDSYLKYNYYNIFETIILKKIIVQLPIKKYWNQKICLMNSIGLQLLTNSKNISINSYSIRNILYKENMYNFLTKFIYVYILTFTLEKKQELINLISKQQSIVFCIDDIKEHAYELLNEYDKFKYLKEIHITLVFNTKSKKLISNFLTYFLIRKADENTFY